MQLNNTQVQASAAPAGAELATGRADHAANLRVSRRSARANGWLLPAVTAIVIVALLLRLPTLSSRSVWMDEAYSYWFASLSWSDLWFKVPFYETHPPFYYSLLKLWTGFAGWSEAGMRWLSVLASLATIALTGLTPRLLNLERRYDKIGVTAALLLAVNAGSIEYAQQARPYAVETLFACLMIVTSLMLLKRMLVDGRNGAAIRGGWSLVVTLGVCAGITLWLHNTSPFVILGNWLGMFGAILLFSPRKRVDLMLAGAALAIALLVWSPCVPIILIESRTVATAFWVTISPKMLSWPLTQAAGGRFAFLPAFVVAVLGWLWVYKTRKPLALYCLSALFVPLFTIFLVSYLFTPVFVTRTFEWMAPPFLFLVAAGLFVPGKMEKARFPLLTLITLLCVVQVVNYYRTPTEDLRGAVQYLASHKEADDLLLVYPNEMEVGLHYYLRQLPDTFNVEAVPARYPAIGLRRPYLGSNKGTPAAIDSDRPQIARVVSAHKRVWFIGEWPGPDGKMDVVTSELYKQRGAPVSTVDFEGIKVSLFAGK
jgi:mannosyltransferase